MFDNVILGAGMTGLSSAYYLKNNYFLAEKTNRVGGLAGSIETNGFLFDYAEHFLRIPVDFIENLFNKIMGDNISTQELQGAIYFKEKYIPYPFQDNIRELPLKELKKCAKSLILNHFSKKMSVEDIENFEEFIFYYYGDYIAKNFMIPYNQKIWRIKPSEMNTRWALKQKFFLSQDLDQIINTILPSPENTSSKKSIRWYPIKGGSQALANSFIPYISNLALNHEAIRVEIEQKSVHFLNGHSESYKHLVSTIPLPELLKIIEPINPEIEKLIPKLKYNSVYVVNFCLNSRNNQKYHWLYFPQKEIPFSRLFFSHNFSKYNIPQGKGSCSALATFLPNSHFDSNKFERDTITELIKLGFIKDESSIIDKIPLEIKYGFTLPTIDVPECLDTILKYLEENNIYSIGRYGEWKYSGIEHSIEDGKKIATILL